MFKRFVIATVAVFALLGTGTAVTPAHAAAAAASPTYCGWHSTSLNVNGGITDTLRVDFCHNGAQAWVVVYNVSCQAAWGFSCDSQTVNVYGSGSSEAQVVARFYQHCGPWACNKVVDLYSYANGAWGVWAGNL